jgi:RHS repeat-associated protein
MTPPQRIQLLAEPGSVGFDNNGNTATKVDSTGTTTYAWDFENRLTSVTLPGTGGTVSFKYDPFGRRIYKSSSSGTSIFAYDGANLIEETSSSGAVVTRYSQTQNVDEPLAMLRSGVTSYYHADGLDSVTSLSNVAGALIQTYAYDSFGKQINSSGSLISPFRYTAREVDAETGVYFYRNRYYDPAAGRFLSEDPIGFEAGDNFYAYTRNSPLNATDPSGLQSDDYPCGYLFQPICDWLWPKPKRRKETCVCFRSSLTPKGKFEVCTYRCNCTFSKQLLITLPTLKKQFPDKCKDITYCPYEVILEQNGLYDNHYHPIDVTVDPPVPGGSSGAPKKP